MVVAVSMILRVWVMYGRSRLILGALLTIFCMEIILFFLCAAIYSNPKFMLGMWMLPVAKHHTDQFFAASPFSIAIVHWQ